MGHWQKIRNEASNLHRELCKVHNLDELSLANTTEFLEKTLDHLELFLSPEHPDSSNLFKSLAVLEDDVIYFDNQLPKWFRTYCIAHEVAHFKLHQLSTHCSREDIEDFDTDEELPTAASQVVGYGAGERREREANLFALELLLPCHVLRHVFTEQKLSAEDISGISGLPKDMVCRQLARAVLTPPAEIEEEKVVEFFELDESQQRAAETEKCPVLISAGPGTGKTQTLIKRIIYLLDKGILPKRILALTFSNKATEEMRERLALARPVEAKQIQIMTFHSFGLEILRKFWKEADLDPHSELLDRIDALLYLERKLIRIDLEHYQTLSEPTRNLSPILGAISRAKDELCSPENYHLLSKKMLAEAEDDEAKLKAEKCLETARVYEFYQKNLKRKKQLDFGELIFRAVRLLQEDESIRQKVSGQYEAILVDEFQDVNRACGVLLKEVAGEGKGLWAVGDLRQSIYRWRGASPANLKQFDSDFPGAETLSLEKNYRSKEGIVKTFSAFAGQMRAAGEEVFKDWKADRGNDPDKKYVFLEIADSLQKEAENLADNILKYQEKGVSYKEQAVICRTHKQLNSFARVLTEKGIPVFYLGELFEREEIRDLLALLDLKNSLNGHSLVRVAYFDEYKIPLADVLLMIGYLKEKEILFEEVLQNEEIDGKLSSAGRRGWRKLKTHLLILKNDISAWKFLSEYLFCESAFLSSLMKTEDIQSQQILLAIYQFLNFSQEMEKRFAGEGELQIKAFLQYVKRLAWFGEDKNFSQIPSVAENLDAVRLLTVHSAKGLEFKTVYVPYLGAGKFPAGRQGQTCPEPVGMVESETEFHEEEEECLFFVAMSRARDHLHLSRASSYGKSNSNESKFLTALTENLPEPQQIFTEDEPEKIVLPDIRRQEISRHTFYSAELDRYLQCPRQYYYSHVLGLKARGEASAYLKFHSCVYDTIRTLQTVRKNENIEISEATAIERLEEVWQETDLDEHPYSPIYLQKAKEIIGLMCRRIANSNKDEILRPSYEVGFENAAVRVQPDAVEISGENEEKRVVFKRMRTGKSPKKAAADDIDVLLFEVAKKEFPDAVSSLEKIYLSDDTVQEVTVTKRVAGNRLKKYQEAIDSIHRKDFPTRSGNDNCPTCPHFFICPSGQ